MCFFSSYVCNVDGLKLVQTLSLICNVCELTPQVKPQGKAVIPRGVVAALAKRVGSVQPKVVAPKVVAPWRKVAAPLQPEPQPVPPKAMPKVVAPLQPKVVPPSQPEPTAEATAEPGTTPKAPWRRGFIMAPPPSRPAPPPPSRPAPPKPPEVHTPRAPAGPPPPHLLKRKAAMHEDIIDLLRVQSVEERAVENPDS